MSERKQEIEREREREREREKIELRGGRALPLSCYCGQIPSHWFLLTLSTVCQDYEQSVNITSVIIA